MLYEGGKSIMQRGLVENGRLDIKRGERYA
jgi:hypothetical protein